MKEAFGEITMGNAFSNGIPITRATMSREDVYGDFVPPQWLKLHGKTTHMIFSFLRCYDPCLNSS